MFGLSSYPSELPPLVRDYVKKTYNYHSPPILPCPFALLNHSSRDPQVNLNNHPSLWTLESEILHWRLFSELFTEIRNVATNPQPVMIFHQYLLHITHNKKPTERTLLMSEDIWLNRMWNHGDDEFPTFMGCLDLVLLQQSNQWQFHYSELSGD